ncbi:Fis family transcriptional regulator [Marinomonas sp. M1K-6]|uniref:Fis family transcriptional regulator n=1 Tax=Marinomonas profundi TaxID=2726122 RepID=A0A847R0D4_9GAMM|nr:Fis family transcriptional regulator [Marinomonas profundi]NLQ16905.1 Fis family transcriptional regulator [Marinomonas profundi]UDV02636.1 Fis family transcriptional regulator [Marinomonas profundi]
MKKSDKKIENALREALTKVCETALASVNGFVWLTHLVDYNAFPNSLKIVCVFDTDEALSNAIDAKQNDYLYELIKCELNVVNIKLDKLRQSVSFDTEEACERSHAGKWHERLARRQSKVMLH